MFFSYFPFRETMTVWMNETKISIVRILWDNMFGECSYAPFPLAPFIPCWLNIWVIRGESKIKWLRLKVIINICFIKKQENKATLAALLLHPWRCPYLFSFHPWLGSLSIFPTTLMFNFMICGLWQNFKLSISVSFFVCVLCKFWFLEVKKHQLTLGIFSRGEVKLPWIFFFATKSINQHHIVMAGKSIFNINHQFY
jgi:hypothetical protein